MVLVAAGIFTESRGRQRRPKGRTEAYKVAAETYRKIVAETNYETIISYLKNILKTAPKEFLKGESKTKILLNIEDISKEMINEKKKSLFDKFHKKIVDTTNRMIKLDKKLLNQFY